MSAFANDETAAIEAVAVAYLTAFVREDVDTVLDAYAEDGVLMGPGLLPVEGKGALAMAYPAVFAAVDFNVKYTIKETVQISEDWGYVRSTTEGTETIKATGDVTPVTYAELFLIRKSAGSWKIARYCTTKTGPA